MTAEINPSVGAFSAVAVLQTETVRVNTRGALSMSKLQGEPDQTQESLH